MNTVYRNFTLAQLDSAYDNRGAVPNVGVLRVEREQRSVALDQRVRHDRDLPYGPSARQRLDFYHCGHADRPTVAYIHGGYWQWNDKEPHSFIAAGLLERGLNVVNIEYTLTPTATITQIVAEIHACMVWLLPRLSTQFGASEKLIVSGHSAGGHLTAIALEVPGVHGGIAISGLFDLEPIQLGSLNAAMRMTAQEARLNSPAHRQPGHAPCIVAVGGAELPELVRQSRDYETFLRTKGCDVRELVIPGEDHFSILEQLAQPHGVLANAAVELAERSVDRLSRADR